MNTVFGSASRATALAAALLALAGCSLVPTYERPATPVAATYPDQPVAAAGAIESAAAADIPWQQFVPDEKLRVLVQTALDHNRDLRVAIANVAQARAQFQIRRADQLPAVGATAGGMRSTPNPYAALGSGSVSSSYTVGLGVSAWELDFFGRVAALKDVALANYLATEEARKAAQVSLIASVVSTWLQAQTDTELLGLAERTLASRQQSLALIRLRAEHGASSALDLKQAEGLVESTRAARAQQRRLRAQDLNLLTLLVGTTLPAELVPPLPAAPGQPAVAMAPVADFPEFPEVPAGLPSELLLRRPDVRAAEQQLIGANAHIGAARANFFPRITLTGSLGRVSADLDGLVGSGGSKAWSFGPSVTLPIFDAGRNRATLEAAEAEREIATAQYEKAIQVAFREVADALAGRATLADQLHALRAQTAAAQDSLRLADMRYRNGVSSYLNLLDAERSLFAAEQQWAQVQLAQRVNEVQLYKALGGGWSAADAGTATGSERAPNDATSGAGRS
jgi:multidrug efflux system outer membrane protein